VSDWSLKNRAGTLLGVRKSLCVGRYLYRFIIDGAERVNAQASQATDPATGKLCNVVVVSSGPRQPRLALQPLDPRSQSQSVVASIGGHAADMTSSSSSCSVSGKQGEAAELTQRLRRLALRNLQLCDDGLWALATQIAASYSGSAIPGSCNRVTEEVDLSFNGFSDEGLQVFARCLPLLPALHTLQLNGNGFGPDGCRGLCLQLQSLKAGVEGFGGLRQLELSGSRLGDEGLENVAGWLRHNPCMQRLFLDACLLGDDAMQWLQQALLANKVLQRLSLQGNRIGPIGCERLMRALQNNASLQVLQLNANPLGPEGAKSVGHMLAANDSLSELEVSDCGIYEEGLVFGLHAICFGLRSNRHLTSLGLRNSRLVDINALSLSEALQVNRTVLKLDLAGNLITRKWTCADALLLTYSDEHITAVNVPNITHCLDKNRRLFEQAPDHVLFREKPRAVHPSNEGVWTKQRAWRVISDSERVKNMARNAAARNERERMQAEQRFVKQRLGEFLQNVQHFLSEEGCSLFVSALAKLLATYVRHQLVTFNARTMLAPSPSPDPTASSDPASSPAAVAVFSAAWSLSSSSSVASLSTLSHPLPPITPITPNAASHAPPPPVGVAVDEPTQLFLHTHLSMLAALFSQQAAQATKPPNAAKSKSSGHSRRRLEADDEPAADGEVHSSPLRAYLHPARLPQIMQLLALPVSSLRLQQTIEAAGDPASGYLSLFRLADHLLAHMQDLFSSVDALQRLRILADLALKPPVEEAKSIILDSAEHRAKADLLQTFRCMPGNTPLFVCRQCSRRFATANQLTLHTKRGDRSADHRKHRAVCLVQAAHWALLGVVKRQLSGMNFPTYMELVPHGDKQFSSDQLVHSQQVLDKLGLQGRPLAAVQEGHSVRALDMFGDFLLVSVSKTRSIHGQEEQGWVRFRRGNQALLRPVGGGRLDLDSLRLHPIQSPGHFRVSDLLPRDVRLKVYYQPVLDGGEKNICGHLSLHDVVECYAEISDWLQIRFGDEDSAWVRWVGERDRSPGAKKGQRRVKVGENIFGDDYLSYELDGRVLRVLQRPEEPITPERVALFDRVRYLGPPTPDPTALEGEDSDDENAEADDGRKKRRLLLHRLPEGLGQLLLCDEGGVKRSSPRRVDQKTLLQSLLSHPDISYEQRQPQLEGSDEGTVSEQEDDLEDSEMYHFPST